MWDFTKNPTSLTHEQWLGQNPMKFHRIEGVIAIKNRGQLSRKLDRLLDKDIYTISKKDRWMLDLDLSDKAAMSMREIEYLSF